MHHVRGRPHTSPPARRFRLTLPAVRDARIAIVLVVAGMVVGAATQALHAPPSAPPARQSTVAPAQHRPPAPAAVDGAVSRAVDEFFTDPAQRSEVRMLLHCLLYRESHHVTTTADGDGGLASGPLQFHQATWEEYRTVMLARGLADSIGSRDDLHEAIRTTVWAIKDGRASAWGPIRRAMAGRRDATCPVPSWY